MAVRVNKSSTWCRQKNVHFSWEKYLFFLFLKHLFFFSVITRSVFFYDTWGLKMSSVGPHWQTKHKSVGLLLFFSFFFFLLCGTTRPWRQRSLQLLVCPRVTHSCSWITSLWGWIFIIGNRGSSPTRASFPRFCSSGSSPPTRNRATTSASF